MSRRTIIIKFTEPIDGTLVHRVRNLGEDLYREFIRNGQASISLSDIDSATDQLTLKVSATRHLGTVSKFIERSLLQHGLAERAQVKR